MAKSCGFASLSSTEIKNNTHKTAGVVKSIICCFLSLGVLAIPFDIVNIVSIAL
jgi:hypothetical protein